MSPTSKHGPVETVIGPSSGVDPEVASVVDVSALAARGFGKQEFTEVTDIVAQALQPSSDRNASQQLRTRVEKLAAAFPLYPKLNGAF